MKHQRVYYECYLFVSLIILPSAQYCMRKVGGNQSHQSWSGLIRAIRQLKDWNPQILKQSDINLELHQRLQIIAALKVYISNIIFHKRDSACLPFTKADGFQRKNLKKCPIYLYLFIERHIYFFLVLGHIGRFRKQIWNVLLFWRQGHAPANLTLQSASNHHLD